MESNHSFQTKFAVDSYSNCRRLWDTPIFECASFVAVPTVGPLIEGWLLVIPKTPVLSFACIPPSKYGELESFLDDVVSTVEQTYGAVAVFEHGPENVGSCLGCGVDYAHLHLVPTRFDLLAGAQKIAPHIKWNQVKSLRSLSEGAHASEGYWYLKQNYKTDVSYIGKCFNQRPVNQLFRRVIADYLGNPSAFDWKHSAGESIIKATRDKLANCLHEA